MWIKLWGLRRSLRRFQLLIRFYQIVKREKLMISLGQLLLSLVLGVEQGLRVIHLVGDLTLLVAMGVFHIHILLLKVDKIIKGLQIRLIFLNRFLGWGGLELSLLRGLGEDRLIRWSLLLMRLCMELKKRWRLRGWR